MKCIQINMYIHDYARICMCIHIYRNLYMNICVHTWHVYKYNKYNKHNKYNRSPKHEFWRGVSPRITFFSRGKWQKRSFSTNRDIFLWKKTHLVQRNVFLKQMKCIQNITGLPRMNFECVTPIKHTHTFKKHT